jgi:hypothetical protein
MESRGFNYYEARGFGVYYLANIIFNVVSGPQPYLNRIEEILGDAATEFFMRPFKKYTNLHEFIRCVVHDVITEGVRDVNEEGDFLREFLKVYNVECAASIIDDEDAFADFALESDQFHDALDEITEEIFHVLFNDVGFLLEFNRLCADYIEFSGFGKTFTTRAGTLRRVAIPIWVRRGIFHRDKGECRSCKRSLAALINRLDTERYDHIVPLKRFGANDITNLQLLCESCNSKKSAKEFPVSKLYQRAIS